MHMVLQKHIPNKPQRTDRAGFSGFRQIGELGSRGSCVNGKVFFWLFWKEGQSINRKARYYEKIDYINYIGVLYAGFACWVFRSGK